MHSEALLRYALSYSLIKIIRYLGNGRIISFQNALQEGPWTVPEKKPPLVALFLKLQQTDYRLRTLFLLLLLTHINKIQLWSPTIKLRNYQQALEEKRIQEYIKCVYRKCDKKRQKISHLFSLFYNLYECCSQLSLNIKEAFDGNIILK